jgi:16S rRNA (uracil1498-N3)-methyltransferase
MHRFYLAPSDCRGDLLTLPESEAHHAVRVLRIRKGERVVVLDGAGTEILGEVAEPSASRLSIRALHRNSIPPLPYQVTLLQALTRGRTMDLIVQKATELGVHRIIPIVSERSVAQLGDDDADSKVTKWESTVTEAIKQCGSAWRPQIGSPVTPSAFLASGERFELPLIASLKPDSRHPRARFEAFLAEHQRRPNSVGVWIGPEGDFTPGEMNAIQSAGALPITLGQLVLRSETAAIYCLSVINYELQSPEMDSSA